MLSIPETFAAGTRQQRRNVGVLYLEGLPEKKGVTFRHPDTAKAATTLKKSPSQPFFAPNKTILCTLQSLVKSTV